MKFEGEIGEIELISRLVELGREKFTGALRFENDAIIKIIYFKEGDILSASTNDRTDSLDEILLKAGKVTREHLKQALSQRKESETLGDALLNLGFITKKELTWARRVQVIGIIRSIRQWTSGTYTLVADYLPKREEGTIFNLAQIVLELLLTETDRARLDPTIASGEAIFGTTPDFDKYYPELGLNQEADTILTSVDGSRTAAEVVEASSSDAFNVYKLLQALEHLGLIDRRQPQVPHELSGHTEQIEWNEPLPPLPSDPTPTVVAPVYSPSPEVPSSFDFENDELPLTQTLAVENDYISEAAIVPPEPGEPVSPRQSQKTMFGTVAPRPSRSSRPLVFVIALVILAGLGYGVYRYLNTRAPEETVVAAAPVRAPRPRPQPTGTTLASTDSTGTTTSAMTAEAAPVTSLQPAAVQPAAATTTITPSTPVASSQSPAATASEVPPPVRVAAVKPIARRTAPVQSPTATASSPSSASITEPVSAPAAATTTRTPPPVALAANTAPSELQQRYDVMARANRNQIASAAFTLQFELVCRPESITKALSIGGGRVWFVPITYRGGSCYRVFWGKYATRSEAERAISQIPPSLRESKPVVVNLKALAGN